MCQNTLRRSRFIAFSVTKDDHIQEWISRGAIIAAINNDTNIPQPWVMFKDWAVDIVRQLAPLKQVQVIVLSLPGPIVLSELGLEFDLGIRDDEAPLALTVQRPEPASLQSDSVCVNTILRHLLSLSKGGLIGKFRTSASSGSHSIQVVAGSLIPVLEELGVLNRLSLQSRGRSFPAK